MRPLHRAPLVALLIAFLASAGLSYAKEKPMDVKDTIKKTYKVRPGGTLYVDIDHGNIEVSTTTKDAVFIEIERVVNVDDPEDAKRIFERHRYELEQNDGDVHVSSKYDEDDSFWGRWRKKGRMKVRLYIKVPEEYNVDFSSGAGNVEVDALIGFVSGSVGAGNISVGEVDGPVDIKSGSGNIVIRGAKDHVEVKNGAGNIDLFDIAGEVEAATGAGNISAVITRQPDNDSELESGAGNVTVTLRGDIGLYVDAVSSMGNASTDFPLKVESKWMKKSFEGQINGGGPELRMRCGVGNVTLAKR